MVRLVLTKKAGDEAKDSSEKMKNEIHDVISALGKFMDGFKGVWYFICYIEHEVSEIMNRQAMTKELKLHYQTMREKASDLINICESVAKVAHTFESDIGALRVDEIHVQKWIKKQQNLFQRMDPSTVMLTKELDDMFKKCPFELQMS
ncbi:hypothetical protein HOLleu_35613 [Holothuria leucospilota]|uniref:Uncharacterized protein n=1 Tax=Holothuria leucospilota TaxID=206669 RepID=A0A9Q1BG08_HOLLE|nr:hypothetical protein HOLleu_35613 [Holothuria leucospilota]